MTVLKVDCPWGHSPSNDPNSLISNLRTWKVLQDVKQGDFSSLAQAVHFYPRFMPSTFIGPFLAAVLEKLGLETMSIMIYLNPKIWEFSRRHVSNETRGPHVMNPDDLILKCVEVAGVRLYCVIFKKEHSPSLMGTWTRSGAGISIRFAEWLLPKIDTLVEVPVRDWRNPPAPTWAPEEPVHQALRERINELVHHGAIDPAKVTSRPEDVYLFPTGMNGIFNLSQLIFGFRPGHVVLFGVPYHTTYEFCKETFHGNYKHFATINEQTTDELEAWIEKEASAGNPVSFILTEAPCNPTLQMADMARLQRLSVKYGFVTIIDDTVGSFANIDVLPLCHVLWTSITKTFSGKADCIGGSIVLNPQSPNYSGLSSLLAETHHNELYAADAKVLLSNSDEYFPRMKVFNRNAEIMAEYLHKQALDPNSPVTKVRYPSLLHPDKENYEKVMRRSTPDFPNPGYGSLLLVEFKSVSATVAFYDRCGFLISPHIGCPWTMAFGANSFLFRRTEEECAYFDQNGVLETGIRIAAGLEDQQDLIDTLDDALKAASEAEKSSQA